MKFFISILFFILSLSLNTHAQEESKNFEKEVKDYIEGKTDIKPKFLKKDNSESIKIGPSESMSKSKKNTIDP